MASVSKYGRRSPANFALILAILFTFLLAAAAIHDRQIERNVLNKILTTSDINISDSASYPTNQHVTCGTTEVKVLGIYPAMGTEMGGTPVAVALQTNYNGDFVDLSMLSTLKCKFGETTQPTVQGSEVGVQMERIASTMSSSTNALFGDSLQLLVCIAPPFPVSSAVPGPLPFSVLCEDEKQEAPQDTTFEFEFTLVSSGHYISPPLGRAGTKVTVKGNGFRNSSSLTCFFGESSAVKAEFVSSDTVICAAPDQEDGEYSVTVSNNGIDVEGEWNGVIFDYVPLPIVNGVQLQTLTSSTNTTVSITGLHLAPRPSAIPVCSFGENATSLAVFASDDMLSCTIPAIRDGSNHNPFIFDIRVSSNGGIDFSTSSARVFVYQPVVLQLAQPDAAQIGSTIILHGENFHPSNLLSCWFHFEEDDDHISLPSTYISWSKVECQTPQSRKGIAQLWVSTDNQESGRSLNSLDIEVLDPISLFSITPSAGSRLGGTPLVVCGTGFQSHSDKKSPTMCRFGVATVTAKAINSTCLSIVSPPLGGNSFETWSQAHDSFEVVVVSLQISTNGGYDYTDSGTFQYLDQLSIESMSPNSSPQWGGTLINFYGEGIGNASVALGALNCHFSLDGLDYEVPLSPIKTIDEDSLSCRTPPISSILAESFRMTSAHVEIIGNGGEVAIATGGAMVSFFPKATLTKLSPLGGSELGGTVVEIQGSNFIQTGLKCLFNGIESPFAQWISPSRIVCMAPEAASRLLHSSIVNVTIAMNEGEILSTDNLPFVYLPASHILTFNPTFGSLDGGTPIHIHGSGFEQIEGLQPLCLFSSLKEPTIATLLSRTLIKCTLPPADLDDTTSIALSFNGGSDVVSTDARFSYVSPAAIDFFSPKYISSNGGTKVTITGKHFIPGGNLREAWRCSFGDTVVAATATTTKTMDCFAPPMPPGLVEVGVSVNGVDFTTHALEVIYHLPSEIHEIVPPFAPETGGNNIVVRGANFQPAPDLSCIFSVSQGDHIIAASFISSEEVQCSVPPSDTGTTNATLIISSSTKNPRENPKMSFQYHALISISSSKLDGNNIVLKADSFPSLEEGLVCCFTPLGDGESVTSSTTKAQVVSLREVRCATPTKHHGAANFSIVLGIAYNDTCHDLTYPQANSIIFSYSSDEITMSEVRPIFNSDNESKLHTFDKTAIIVEPTDFSEMGGSKINIVSPKMEINGDASCIFSATTDKPSQPMFKSPASIVTKHRAYTDGQQLDSQLLTCESPRMAPGEYLLSLESSDTLSGMIEWDIAVVAVHSAFSVIGFEPSSGPSSGGTDMTLHGSNFPNTANLSCKIGGIITRANFVSQEKIRCTTPPIDVSSTSLSLNFYISVSSNGQDFEEVEGLLFSYIDPPFVSKIFPAAGSVTGGTSLTIHGKNLLPNNADGVFVSFGNIMVKGFSLNETAVTCTTPPLETSCLDSSVLVRVSTNGGYDSSHDGIIFSCKQFLIVRIDPPYGPEKGGNTVTIIGSGFTANHFAACKFADNVVPARFTSVSSMECVVPNSVAHSIVDVSLTIDGVEWASSPQTYVYLPMLHVSNIWPPTLPTDVPYSVHIQGENFGHPSELICIIGSSVSTKAVVIDDNSLKCPIPPIHKPGEVMLDIVTAGGGDSLLESSSIINFYDPLDFHISPSFGNMNGGTVVSVFLDSPQSIGTELICRFSLRNEQFSFVDVMASPFNGTHLSCVTPNAKTVGWTDDILYSSISVISRGLSLPVYLSFPFMFKTLPVVKSISPNIGSGANGTQIRVIGDGPGLWLNSSMLTCYFGKETVKAKWIAPLVVDCGFPSSQNISEVSLSISDNGADLVDSESTFLFHPDPLVTSVDPSFGLALNDNIVILAGSRFSGRGAPMCMFLERHEHGEELFHLVVEGRVVNETAMECRIPSNMLAPSVYECKASNNGGLEWGPAGAYFESLRPPSIVSLKPKSGIQAEFVSVAVMGTNLAAKGSKHTYCVLSDHAGSRMGSSLAESVNDTLVNCPLQCPNRNAKYLLGVSLSNRVHPSSMHEFWCDPKPTITDVMPRVISVGELSSIRIRMSDLRPTNVVECRFSGNSHITATPGGSISSGVLECLSPEFDRPQKVTLSVSVNNLTLPDTLQLDVVDLMSVYSISPKTIFASSRVHIKGSNIVPEKTNCSIGGREGSIVMTNKSDGVVCIPPPNMEANPAAEVSLSFKKAPLLSVMAGTIEIRPTPRVKKIMPSSGLMHGGTNVIIRGQNFNAIEPPLCYFGDVAALAHVLTRKSISCVSPKSQAGKVQLQVSLDGGDSFQGEQPFSFFSPIILHEVYPRVAINGTNLLLRGEGFRFDIPVQCMIGGTSFVPAMVLSSTEASCIFTSATEDPGFELIETHHPLVEISIVTSDRISASVGIGPNTSVVYQPSVEISSALPLHGSVNGGESIELQVSGIMSDATKEGLGPIYCLFDNVLGNKIALATVLNESAISCMAPAAKTHGNVSLSLLYDGFQPLSSNTLAFEYTLVPKVFGFSPTHGPYSGGTSVKIDVLNLLPQSLVLCRFGHHESYGYFDTSENSVIYCITPLLTYQSSETLFLKLDPAKDWIDTGFDFHFFEPMSIESLSPIELYHGVEFIRVKGKGFSTATGLLCSFGERHTQTITEAILLSNTTIKCPFPWEATNDFGPQIALSVTSNSVDFVRSPSPLIYKRGMGAVVTSLSPALGPAFGASYVHIYGTGFTANMKCWFGSVAVRATLVSDNHIQCLSSPMFIKDSQLVAFSNVSVTHGHSIVTHFSGNSLKFAFYSHPSKLVMLPTHGAAMGETKVRIIGVLVDILKRLNALDVQGKPLCRFDTNTVPATVEDKDLVCVSPPMETETNSKAVSFAVSLNGEDFVRALHHFHYYHLPYVNSITPEMIWIGEATELVLLGSHFIPLDQASCFIGDIMVPAEVISNSEIRCLILLNQTYSNEIVPVGVSLNKQDASNIIPIICRVHRPRITSAHPLFVSDSGDTVVELKGYDFGQIKTGGFVKLLPNTNTSHSLRKLVVVDDETASFDVPSSNGQASANILISFGSDNFAETGFELQYLPHLHISGVYPPFVFVNKETRVKVWGKFDQTATHACVLLDGASHHILEVTAECRNRTMLICDVVMPTISYTSTLSLAVRRNEDNQTSNALKISPTPHYAIHAIAPSTISDAEAGAGGLLLSITSPSEYAFSSYETLTCRFLDEIGTMTMVRADVISLNEVRCVAPALAGDAEVRLAMDGTSQSNPLTLSVRPTSQIMSLSPDSGPVSGGTRVKVHGVGFAAYSQGNVSCIFGSGLSIVEFVDDETIYCFAPSTDVGGDMVFGLVQASTHGLGKISNSVIFFYYLQPKLVACKPRVGPASGGAELKLLGEGFSTIESSIMISFSSTSDPNRVAYLEEVKLLSNSTLVLSIPPSPNGSEGGTVIIQVSGNGEDYSSSGVYYNYTESIFVRSFHPHQVAESSCFNLTLLVDNLFSSPSHCLVGGQTYSARQGVVSDAVICEMCLDLHEDFHNVGIFTDGIFTYASKKLEVRRRINITKMVPPMGHIDGGTVVTVGGNDFEVWDDQLYCFFGNDPSLATVLNNTALQCVTPASPEGKPLSQAVNVAPYGQLKKDPYSAMLYNYYALEETDSVIPRSGPIEGGTIVQIFGSGFIDTLDLSCKFGDTSTRAVFVSAFMIECTSPPLTDTLALHEAPLKSIPLMISNNGVDHVPSGTFIYRGTPEITRLLPSTGPALTKVTLTVQSSLGWVEKLACQFGDVLAPCNVTSDSKIECLSPIQSDDVTPHVTVQLSLNGVDFFGEGLTFQYSNKPLIYSMKQNKGPMSGGNEVVFRGKNLDFGLGSKIALLCRFGLIETTATHVSATKITCTAPPQNQHGTVFASIVSKQPNIVLDQYYNDDLMIYIYISPMVISTISPAFGSINGGTSLVISVYQQHPLPTFENLFCIFANKTATAAHVEESNDVMAVISCLTPPSNAVSSGPSGLVSVGLALDLKATLISSAAQFQYKAQPKIKTIFPRRGPSDGGTILTLEGNFDYNDMDSTHCKIGDQTSPAIFVSAEEVKCIVPGKDHAVREIQAIRITGDDNGVNSIEGSLTLRFKGGVTDSISASASAEKMREKLSFLPGLDNIAITTESALMSSQIVRKSFLITFLGLVHEDQPMINVNDIGIIGDNSSVTVERIQSLCCDVSLTLNGVDYHGADNGHPLMFVYDEKFVVTSISPGLGSVNGGTDVNVIVSGMTPSTHAVEQRGTRLMCIFGSEEVEGRWVNEETVSCSTPANKWETKVTVGIRVGDVRSESMATFLFYPDPVLLSIFPESLPAFDMTTSFIDINGNHFLNNSLTCVFDASIPSNEGTSLQRRHGVDRQPAIFYNSTFIRCPQPPAVESFFSTTDSSWAANETLLDDTVLELSLEAGADWYFVRMIPFHAVVKVSSVYPRTGPRAGETDVMVEGENFVNSTHLTCKFGSELGPLAQYISPTKVLCKSPHFSSGYGRVILHVRVAVNGADFSAASDRALFEFHEPIVITEVAPLVGLPKGGTVVEVFLDDHTMRLRAVSLQDENNRASISRVDPSYGPETGGNLVTIHGSGFTPNHYTGCKFGDIVTLAYFISEELIECSAPKSSTHSVVDVTLTIDGVDMAPLKYVYLPMLGR